MVPGDTLFIETITFEYSYPYLEVDTSNQNIWQIGTPNKAFFDSAYSAKNAIITDTVNYYPIDNISYFDLLIGAFNFNDLYPWNIYVGIKHKYDTDTLKDGGFITISYDNRTTWMNIINILQTRLDEHLDKNPPDAPSLTDIIGI